MHPKNMYKEKLDFKKYGINYDKFNFSDDTDLRNLVCQQFLVDFGLIFGAGFFLCCWKNLIYICIKNFPSLIPLKRDAPDEYPNPKTA